MKQPVEVHIMGQRFTVTSDEGVAHVREVADYVDRQMRQLADRKANASLVHLALLTALNIASEYWKLQRERENLDQTINRLSRRVLARLDR
jgi:cell division protein ZapA